MDDMVISGMGKSRYSALPSDLGPVESNTHTNPFRNCQYLQSEVHKLLGRNEHQALLELVEAPHNWAKSSFIQLAFILVTPVSAAMVKGLSVFPL